MNQKHYEGVYRNDELHFRIIDLVDEGRLDKNTAGYGASQIVINKGYDYLTEAQKYAYDNYVSPLIENMEIVETLEKM
ncbi:hypothetical protein [Pedobacter sp. L105]|uniref:hypothetical protein n=1 Tax=Pedobacter sp. L105 TaxID=1641871 RepID=UPI00131D83D3|nr:hypothetical protein [Pedobacter sp. L105]